MLTTALLAIAIALLMCIVRKAHKINQLWAERGIKHLKPALFFGNNLPALLGRESAKDTLIRLYNLDQSEPIFGYYEFMTPKLFIRDPDLVLKVLITDFTHFTDHGLDINSEKNPRDEQLFFLNGAKWRAVRMKVSPIFTSGKLKEMFSTMKSVGENLLQCLKERESEEIDIRELMGLFSTDVISSAVFGMDPATLKDPNCEFRKMGKKANEPNIRLFLRLIIIFTFPKLAKNIGVCLQDPKVQNYFCNIIQTAFNYRREKGIHRNDFIQLMMQLKEKGKIEIQSLDSSDDYLKMEGPEPNLEKFEITDDLLMAQALTFMVAGFEVTATLMAFVMFQFTQNPDIQERVRNEIAEQVKLNGGLNYDALKNMTLLEAAVKETQRIYPPFPAIYRVCTKDYEFPNGYIIKRGEAVAVPIYPLHMDPNYFPEPDVYKPERFLGSIRPGTFLPFGEGPRMCIAMRYAMMVTKYGIALFLQNYRVKLSEKTKVPLELNHKSFAALPKEKILLELEKIEL